MKSDADKPCQAHWLGQVPYAAAWSLQRALAGQIAAGKRPPSLLLLEHPHTYTFGRRGHVENLLWSRAELEERGVSVHWVDRGGDVTYHGPGQLVAYPILPLGRVRPDSRLPQAEYLFYLRQLEEVIIRTLLRFGVVSGQLNGKTGVWVQPDVASRCPGCPPAARGKPSKIASIGVKVTAQGISEHGLSINVNPDMHFWEGIIPCGLTGTPTISLADLVAEPPEMAAVVEAFLTAFQLVFPYILEKMPLTVP